jgi:preprotein translocase subunit SecG
MATIVLVIHLMIAVALVSVVLMQKSEGGALGIGGSGGGGGGFLTGRGTANLLTRTTAMLAVAFFITSMTLSLLAPGSQNQGSILDRAPVEQNTTPTTPTPSPDGLAPLPTIPQGR